MRALLHRIWRAWKRSQGWHDCPVCGAERSTHWVKDWLYHPEEPPCFGHWECEHCFRSTEIEATFLMDDAARSHGFENFEDFARKRWDGEK